MIFQVEFYGIARQRAGVDHVEIETTTEVMLLGDVVADLSARFPLLAETCFEGRRLRPPFTANISGDRFVSDPETEIHSGDSLLIMSADAGG